MDRVGWCVIYQQAPMRQFSADMAFRWRALDSTTENLIRSLFELGVVVLGRNQVSGSSQTRKRKEKWTMHTSQSRVNLVHCAWHPGFLPCLSSISIQRNENCDHLPKCPKKCTLCWTKSQQWNARRAYPLCLGTFQVDKPVNY
jgi:hypothetical protein